MRYRVGCDVDGVLSVGFRPAESHYIVISGQLACEWEATVKIVGPDHPIYLRPYGEPNQREAAGMWKSEMIRQAGLERFYEDDMLQAQMIAQTCPWCTVLLVSKMPCGGFNTVCYA